MKLQIGRSKYTLVIRKLDEDTDGNCCPEKKIITINKNTEYSDVFETVIHEIIHAECNESGVQHAPGWSTGLEEVLADSISRGITENLEKIFKFKERFNKK